MVTTETKTLSESGVDFSPTKSLFIDVLTKDISIRDCILDLIDNSVDSYIVQGIKGRRNVDVKITDSEFSIVDTCGGIPRAKVLAEVFRLGSTHASKKATIGFYGIGLKRSIFKMGNKITFETDDGSDYTRIDIVVSDWLKEKEWNHPLHPSSNGSRLRKGEKPYTKIHIPVLRDDAKETFTDTFVNNLAQDIHFYYSRLIEKGLKFSLNSQEIEPFKIKVKVTNDLRPVKVQQVINKVQIKVYCWVEPKLIQREKREPGRFGWNIFMNDRLILHDDATEATGWSGIDGELPRIHPIYYQFRGIVFLHTTSPKDLPINTLKNGFNTENSVYIGLKSLMINTARPIVTYLSKKYDHIDDNEAREIQKVTESDKVKNLKEVDIEKVKGIMRFVAPSKPAPKNPQTTINYQRLKTKVDAVKKYLDVKTNSDVGILTFEYFLNSEGIDDK